MSRRSFGAVFAAGVTGMVALPRGWIYDPIAAKAEAMTVAAFRSRASVWHTCGQSAAEAFSSTMSDATRAIFERSIIERRGDMLHIAGIWRFDGGYARLCAAPNYVIPARDPEPIACSPSARPPADLIRD